MHAVRRHKQLVVALLAVETRQVLEEVGHVLAQLRIAAANAVEDEV
jgi:hypothetical protein